MIRILGVFVSLAVLVVGFGCDHGSDAASTAPSDNSPAGYSTVTSTDFGKALFTQKPKATSVTTALQATLPDLAHYFDGKPTIKGAYENSEDHKSGGAVFTGMFKGKAIKGVVSCKLVDKGAAVTVIYCNTDTPPAEWAKLTAEPTVPVSGGAGDNAAAKSLGDSAQVYQFPDGTGSITLADGWKTQADSAINPIFIQGPAEQNVFIGSSIVVYTKDAPMLKMIQSNQARMRQMGGNPPPPPPMFVADFTDPVQAMKDLMPQMSERNKASGGPEVNLDEIISQQDAPCPIKGGKAAIVGWKVTRTLNGVAKQYRGSQRVSMAPVGQGIWTYTATGFTTPVDTFDRDKGAIFAMLGSEKYNEQVISQKMQQQAQQGSAMLKQQADASNAALRANAQQFQQAQDQRFADSQARLAETKQGYDQHNQQFRDDQLQRSRNKDNQVEQILGYRTVYDTQTGLSTAVDLNDVNGVVNSLNKQREIRTGLCRSR